MPIKKKENLLAPARLEFGTVGKTLPLTVNEKAVQLHYAHPRGELFLGDSINWLASLAAESVELIFADPPYNIKKAEWDNFESQEAYIAWSLGWIKEAARVLKPAGSLYVCGFSEILADLKHPAARYFHACRWLGCDLSAEYNQWAIQRLEKVRRLSINEWLELDRRNAERRESIR